MIRQDFYIEPYDWRVTVFYGVTSDWCTEITRMLSHIGCSGENLRRAYRSLVVSRLDTGLTYSNYPLRRTIMVISRTSSPEQFQDSWDHEKGHLVKHIAEAFVLDPFGEKVEYLAGYIGRAMFPVAKRFLCEHCRKELDK